MQRPHQLMAALGKQLEKDLRKHFRALDSKKNKMGFPPRHFWRQVKSATLLTQVTDSRAVVSIASPAFAMKYFGGIITPKRAKALAIPRTAEAYKTGSPREADIDQLDFVPIRRGKLVGVLIKRLQSVLKGKNMVCRPFSRAVRFSFVSGGRKGKKIDGDIQYFLVRVVVQAPDPDAWPDKATLEANLLQKARKVLARVLRIR